MKKDFNEIPNTVFQRFRREFNGEGDWWPVCSRCGGKCEQYSIGSLMPGEKRFISKWLAISITQFEDLYLDRIVTPLGDIDVLKMKPGCLFLDASFRCTLKPVKVVLCEIYPIAFEVKNNDVKFYIDTWCPLGQLKETAQYFEEVGIPALKKLNVPIEWYGAVALYDHFSYDYEKISRKRKDIHKYESFILEEILAARVEIPSGESITIP